MYITSTEEYLKKWDLNSTFHQDSPGVEGTYNYSLALSWEKELPEFQLFYFLNGLSLGVPDRLLTINFDSKKIISRNSSSDSIEIRFFCNYQIRNISFTVLKVYESKKNYDISIEEIGFGQNSGTMLRGENSV